MYTLQTRSSYLFYGNGELAINQ